MPKIPTLSDSPRLRASDPLAPTQSAREAGAPFRQVGALADQVSSSMFQLQKKQQAEADKVSYTKNNIALNESFNEVSGQMEEEYRTTKPNYEGYSDDLMDRMEVHKAFIMEQTPESAKYATGLAFDQKMSSIKGRAKSFESGKKSEFAYNETKGLVGKGADTAYSGYSPMALMGSQSQLRNLVGTSAAFDAKEKQVLGKNINNMPEDMLNGVLHRNSPAEMRKALNDIEDPEMAKVWSGMDPQIIGKKRAQLENKLDNASNKGKRQSNTRANNVMAALRGGTMTSSNPQDRAAIENVKNELMMTHGDKSIPMIDEIEAYEVVSDHMGEKAFDLATFDVEKEAASITADGTDRITSAGSKAKVQNILNSQRQAMIKELKDDPASYVLKHDTGANLSAKEMLSSQNMDDANEAFSDYIGALDTNYDKLGVPVSQRKYMSKPLKEHYGGSIKTFIAQGNAKEAAAVMDDMLNRSGNEAFRFYDELGIPDKYSAVSEVPTSQGRLQAIQNLMNEKEVINPQYKGLDNHISDNDIKSKLRQNDMFKSVMGQNGGTNTQAGVQAESMLHLAQVDYKLSKLAGDSDEMASEKAWANISSGYDIIQNSGSPVAVRKGIHQSEKTRMFLENNTKTDIDYFNKFDLKLHEGSSVEATNEQFKNGARWTYDKKSDSMQLGVYDIKTAGWRRAVNNKGSNVSVKLSDMDKMSDLKESNDRLNARKNIMGMSRMGIVDKKKEQPTMKFKVEGY